MNAYTYDVYGKTTSSSGSQANDVQFAGQQTDPRASSTCARVTTTRDG